MKTRFAFLLIASLPAAPALALNMNYLQDAPITRLSADEVRAFRAFVMKTLDETPDGATVEWRAAKTPFLSKITPQKVFMDGSMKCRDATIDSDSKDRQLRGRYTFCKQGNRDWEFRIPAHAKPAK
jgi:surface antigen